jgi:tryptophan-rich sensory protein
MKRWLARIGFLVLTVGGGLAVGFVTAPGEWYAGLAKPAFNPPSWLFAPVWSVLYVLIAVAGWRTFERERSGRSMRLWWAQLGLNFLWSPVFFSTHQIGAALLVILLLLAVPCRRHCYIVAARPRGRVAFRALCGLGAFCLGAQCSHLASKLIGFQMRPPTIDMPGDHYDIPPKSALLNCAIRPPPRRSATNAACTAAGDKE